MRKLRLLGIAFCCWVPVVSAYADDTTAIEPEMQAFLDGHTNSPKALTAMSATPCVNGMAGSYPCSNIDLLAFVPISQFGAQGTNSLWGWTDKDGTEYALVGADNGTAFYRLTDPTAPTYLGKLPTHTGSSSWRDVRVYQGHAFIVADNNGAHGMQVFDLEALQGVTTPQTFSETAWYGGSLPGAFGRGHTISINEATGYAAVAGSDATCPGDSRNGGLELFDLHVPDAPVYAGCVKDAGYTHESQCWVYAGPDTAHVGKEICVNANGPTQKIALVDVTNKSAPVTLSSVTYSGAKYPHQGWLTDDHRYLLVDDELDETQPPPGTPTHKARTYVWDVSDLDAPVLVGYHDSPLGVIDHNLYVHGQFVYQSNYEAGLRILRMDNLSAAELTEVAYFDVFPNSNNAAFNGNWNNYRFPGSGNVIATSIGEGFFVLQPHLCAVPAAPTLDATPNGDHRIDLAWAGSAASYRVERAQSGCGGQFHTLADAVAANNYTDNSASGSVTYGYRVVARDASGYCTSPASTCVEAQTTGSCTAAPLFNGIGSATDAGTAHCRVDLAWGSAQPACGGPARYSVYRSPLAAFEPGASTLIATGLSGSAFSDYTAASGASQFYVVRADDTTNGAQDANLMRLSAAPTGPRADGTFATGAEPGDPPFDAASVEARDRSPSQVEHIGWHTSTARQHAGTQSFWSTASNNLCVALISPTISLSAGQTTQLAFWTAWDIEQGWDGGVVDVSINGGTSWTRLTPVGGYPGSITNGGTLCGIAQGAGAFTGMGHLAWTPFQFDLAAYAGKDIQLRWLYRTDTAQLGEGWFIDDITLTHTQVPGACTVDSDVIFANGFNP